MSRMLMLARPTAANTLAAVPTLPGRHAPLTDTIETALEAVIALTGQGNHGL